VADANQKAIASVNFAELIHFFQGQSKTNHNESHKQEVRIEPKVQKFKPVCETPKQLVDDAVEEDTNLELFEDSLGENKGSFEDRNQVYCAIIQSDKTCKIEYEETCTKLQKNNEGLVNYVVGKYKVDIHKRKDLIATSNMALVLAAQEYDVEKGTRFITYAYYKILGALKTEMRTSALIRVPDRHIEVLEDDEGADYDFTWDSKANNQKQYELEVAVHRARSGHLAINSNDELGSAQEDGMTYAIGDNHYSLSSHGTDVVEEAMNNVIIASAMKFLNRTEQDLLVDYYVCGMSMSEIGHKMNRSPQAISLRHQKVIAKLQQVMKPE